MRRKTPERNPRTEYICDACREADRRGNTHPGARHDPGICDCECRD